MNLRSILYAVARGMGDARAVQHGTIGKRIERRVLGRFFSRLISAIVGR